MIHKLIIIGLLLGLVACAPTNIEQDGGIGGTGAPVTEV